MGARCFTSFSKVPYEWYISALYNLGCPVSNGLTGSLAAYISFYITIDLVML